MGNTTTALLAWALASLPIAAPAAAATNLVRNGSFETGDLSEWLAGPYDVVDAAPYGVNWPTDGRYHATFATLPGGYTRLLQSFHTTPGQLYRVTFDMAQVWGNQAFYYVKFGQTFIFDGTYDYVPQFDYTRFSARVVAREENTDLYFYFQNNPEAVFLLDDISVVAVTEGVPEPASWAMLIAGFGLVGVAARRHRLANARSPEYATRTVDHNALLAGLEGGLPVC